MVKIPDRPDAYLARGLPDARFAGGGESSAVVSAIGEGAAKLFGAALHIQQQRDHDLLVEAQNRYTSDMTAFSLKAEQEKTGDRARGFTREYAGQSDSTRGNVLQWLKDNGGSGDATRAFANWSTGRKTVGGAEAAKFEHGQMLAHSKDLFTQRVQGITDQLEHNPLAFGDAAGQLEEAFTLAVGQGLFRPQEARAKLHDAREKLALTAFDNMYAIDRGRAMKSMDALGLTPAQQGKAKKKFQADARADAWHARQAKAEARAELAAELPDADYLASQTGDASGLRGMAAELRKLGDVKTAERVERKAGLYESNYAAILESRAMPMSDLLGKIGGLEKDITDMQGRGTGADARKLLSLNGEMEARRNVYKDRLTKLGSDPAAVALYNDEGLAGQLAAEPSEAVVSRLMAKQEALGAGVPGFVPQPLTKAQADDLNARFYSSTDAGEQAAMVLELNKTYGKHATRAMSQARLPAALVAVAPVASALEPAQLVNLAAAAAAKKEDLPALTSDKRKAVEDSDILRTAKAVSDAMYRSGELRTFAAKMADALENYARLDGDVGALDNKFTALTSGNLRILMPKALDFYGIENAFEQATRELLSTVPTDKNATGRKDAARRMQTMYANGFWIYDDSGGFAFVDAATGRPVARRSREEILEAGKRDDPGERYFSGREAL